MGRVKGLKDSKKKNDEETLLRELKKKIDSMSIKELRDLTLINTYKIALMRAQIEALIDIISKKGISDYESFWKDTRKFLDESLL